MNRQISPSPTLFKFLHDLQTRIHPRARAALVQAESITASEKRDRGQAELAAAAAAVEDEYRAGNLSAEDVLVRHSMASLHPAVRNMLQEAADDEGAAQLQPALAPIDINSESEDDTEADGDGEEEEEDDEAETLGHEWQTAKWPEVAAKAAVTATEVSRAEPVDSVVQSVCFVCVTHQDFHYTLGTATCPHTFCLSCVQQIETCPICRKKKGPATKWIKVLNSPSLMRVDSATGRTEVSVIPAHQRAASRASGPRPADSGTAEEDRQRSIAFMDDLNDPTRYHRRPGSSPIPSTSSGPIPSTSSGPIPSTSSGIRRTPVLIPAGRLQERRRRTQRQQPEVLDRVTTRSRSNPSNPNPNNRVDNSDDEGGEPAQ